MSRTGSRLIVDLAGTLSRYDGNTQSHYHFRCEQCGRVFDVDEPVDKEINGRVAQRTGFKVSHHILEFRGLCKDCQSAMNKAGG